ncbi:14 kDa subunit of cytochrome bd ubiquinol oxidase [Dendrothele bispora CBS 962.96]|uniref:Cytochrome b-c1 complex subunit 7 n=1 Tax=Dendrothele bispora (strain CBS 962.96) TaxID=1314807 RepID=A0A4S8LE37_DENBC|nr:14 kDa subunit of cytochrome bd ubiquinol oxidase [Dendrothele bispora CBS 962.96]
MPLFGPLSFSFAPQVLASKTLSRWVKPFAAWYAEQSGYRKYGLKYDDLLMEERDDVQRALGRLTSAEGYDRAFRLKRASQASILHAPLPKEQWTKFSEDGRYLTSHIREVEKEDNERAMWDTVSVKRK